jgi:hypothetical protein
MNDCESRCVIGICHSGWEVGSEELCQIGVHDPCSLGGRERPAIIIFRFHRAQNGQPYHPLLLFVYLSIPRRRFNVPFALVLQIRAATKLSGRPTAHPHPLPHLSLTLDAIFVKSHKCSGGRRARLLTRYLGTIFVLRMANA